MMYHLETYVEIILCNIIILMDYYVNYVSATLYNINFIDVT